MKYIFCSGFGFGHEYWDNIIPLLDYDFCFFDQVKNESIKEECIGIGHSLGFQKLHNSNLKFKKLIGLQGFLDFCDKKNQKRVKELSAMTKILNNPQTNIHNFLKSFYHACGYNGDIRTHFSKEELIPDMIDMQKSYVHNGTQTLIIGSPEDEIVPVEVIENNFRNLKDVTIEYIIGGKHALGHLKPELVFEKIKNWIEN